MFKKIAIALATALSATSIGTLPAVADDANCYETASAYICWKQIGTGEYVVAINQLEYLWPEAAYVVCYDDGTNYVESHGGLTMRERNAHIDYFCN